MKLNSKCILISELSFLLVISYGINNVCLHACPRQYVCIYLPVCLSNQSVEVKKHLPKALAIAMLSSNPINAITANPPPKSWQITAQ